MRIVVDTSVIIAVITNEMHRQNLIKKTVGGDLIAPLSMRYEIGNAFSAMFKRNRIKYEQAIAALGSFNQIPITFFENQLEKSIELAYRLQIYSYDAYFLECALVYNCPILTLDGGLANAAKRLGIETIEV